jgi:hypothetical protein
MRKTFIFLFLCLVQIIDAKAQPTVGLTQNSPGNTDGFVLFSSLSSNSTYLIDKCGRKIHSWESIYRPGLSYYLLPDGTLLRPGNLNNTTFGSGGKGGIIEKIDWDGNVIWSYTVSDATQCQHHDVKALPNGNILIIAWELKTDTEAIAQGRNPNLLPATLWSEQIIEVEPSGATGGNVVWEWHMWDHLVQDFDNTKSNFGVVNSSVDRVNLNYGASATSSDWLHINSIDYNPTLDQILLSVHNFSEIWIIDHSTTTLEAETSAGGNSGKGGHLLYRWGNPQTYNSVGTQKFFKQHNAHWLDTNGPFANQIMVFNNGQGRPGGNYSTIEIINPPVSGSNYSSSLPFQPANFAWQFNAGNPNNLFAQNISGSQQLPNGNVLFCDGPNGIFTEIDTVGSKVWNYINPIGATSISAQGTVAQNATFRAAYYPKTYSGFVGKNISPGTILENTNSISDACVLSLTTSLVKSNASFSIYPNPSYGCLSLQFEEPTIDAFDVTLTNALGQNILSQSIQIGTKKITLNENNLPSGVYLIRLKGEAINVVNRLVVN